MIHGSRLANAGGNNTGVCMDSFWVVLGWYYGSTRVLVAGKKQEISVDI